MGISTNYITSKVFCHFLQGILSKIGNDMNIMYLIGEFGCVPQILGENRRNQLDGLDCLII